MQFPIVREYKTDLENTNLENEKRGEPFKVQAGVWSRVIVPRHSPFFVSSLHMYFPNGEEMIPDQHFRIYRLMSKLTDLTANEVSCMIELIDPSITEGTIDYDVVGEFSLFDTAMMNIIMGAVNDDRPVWWENLHNKPVVFRPKLHSHSLLYDFTAFQDTVELIDMIMKLADDHGRPLIQVKIDHYFDVFNHRLNIYKKMLTDFFDSHKGTVNEHGLTAAQVGLEKVENLATAIGSQVLETRNDLHLTVQGLQSIIDRYGFNDTEFLEANQLPISQFGNTNFIPPNIDGSFEGFGGISENAGICLEPDGSIVFLWNRMDGRVRGLYYSVLTGMDDYPTAKLTYTGFKYEHPKFVPDNANVDRIVQGSGNEVILVGDSRNNLFYVGLTNGSLDPAKHVYSKVDMSAIPKAMFAPTDGSIGDPTRLFPQMSIALMGEWIYFIVSTGADRAGAFDRSDRRFKWFFRVRVADVQSTINVTPVHQKLSYTNPEGEVFTNADSWKWYEVVTNSSAQVTKSLLVFSPYPATNYIGLYRTLVNLVAEDPNRKGIYSLKFVGCFYAAHTSPTLSAGLMFNPEVNYDFNPITGVMTLKSKSAIPPPIDFSSPVLITPEWGGPLASSMITASHQDQGCNVLENGVVIASAAGGPTGFPRAACRFEVVDSKSRYATVSRFWGNFYAKQTLNVGSYPEIITSPIESGIMPKAIGYTDDGGEYYLASTKGTLTTARLFFKTVSGKFAQRPEVTNLFIKPILSRPLTSNVRGVNAKIGMGLACVSVPSADLDKYSMDVGASAFCMSAQKAAFDRDTPGAEWSPVLDPNDLVVISKATRRIEPNGSVTIIPSEEILYPASIVQQLKNQVPNIAGLNKDPNVVVTVNDPTFSLSLKFGWLPVVACVSYRGVPGNADNQTTYQTYLSIQPTYVVQGNRRVVTGFTVLDRIDWSGPATALYPLRVFGNGGEGVATTISPMRVYFYLENNKLTMYFNTGVVGQTVGDVYAVNLKAVYNNRTTKKWSTANLDTRTSLGGGPSLSPDNGCVFIIPWASTTGGAGTIIDGSVSKNLIGSVYPETGWIIFFKTDVGVTFNGKRYVLPLGTIDLRDVDTNPTNKTFYIYAKIDGGEPYYEVSLDKRLESPYQLWVGRVTTNDRQIITLERFNVIVINGHRVSETKRGSSIPATSGLINAEGQIPWLRQDELLP